LIPWSRGCLPPGGATCATFSLREFFEKPEFRRPAIPLRSFGSSCAATPFHSGYSSPGASSASPSASPNAWYDCWCPHDRDGTGQPRDPRAGVRASRTTQQAQPVYVPNVLCCQIADFQSAQVEPIEHPSAAPIRDGTKLRPAPTFAFLETGATC
jgi:hypothetical protein